MDLGYKVLRFIDRVRKQPTDGSDPRLLTQLEQAAREAFFGAVALMAPISPMTWEQTTVIRGGVQQTDRVSFRFPRPVSVVGFFPTLQILTSGGALSPSLDSIACSIDTDSENYLTSGGGVSTPAGGSAGPFVTLSAMSVQVPRIVDYKLKNPTPDIGFTFRWKLLDSNPAAPVFKDALISLAMYARYL